MLSLSAFFARRLLRGIMKNTQKSTPKYEKLGVGGKFCRSSGMPKVANQKRLFKKQNKYPIYMKFLNFKYQNRHPSSPEAPKKHKRAFRSVYDVLEVDISASQTLIRKMYLKKLTTAHPDKGGSLENFLLVQEAYKVLSSPELKELYDSQGSLLFGLFPHFVQLPSYLNP